MADALVSEASDASHEGSTPSLRILLRPKITKEYGSASFLDIKLIW